MACPDCTTAGPCTAHQHLASPEPSVTAPAPTFEVHLPRTRDEVVEQLRDDLERSRKAEGQWIRRYHEESAKWSAELNDLRARLERNAAADWAAARRAVTPPLPEGTSLDDPQKLRTLAAWLDLRHQGGSDEVRRDLRRIADNLEEDQTADLAFRARHNGECTCRACTAFRAKRKAEAEAADLRAEVEKRGNLLCALAFDIEANGYTLGHSEVERLRVEVDRLERIRTKEQRELAGMRRLLAELEAKLVEAQSWRSKLSEYIDKTKVAFGPHRITGQPTYETAAELVAALEAPLPLILTCPACGERHVDEGEFATKSHHTHACQHCGLAWRPAIGPTVGVRFLPGFKNEEVI